MQESAPASARVARAIYRACEIPGASAPYDRVFLKIYYPALPDDGEEQRNAGVVPADRTAAPYPLLLLMPGINVGPEAYGWLACALAMQGIITVTYAMIAEEMPGYVSLTPGLDLSAITPESYGNKPSGSAIAAVLEAVKRENSAGVLEGCIDTSHSVLAGHSAGGSVALFNADPGWFPGVCGAIAYGAHAGASVALGFADNTTLGLPDKVPLLLIAGTEDGVIASSARRYGDDGQEPPDRVRQTFEKGMNSDRGDCYLVEIAGANHFSLAWPVDESTGRHFLEEPIVGDSERVRGLLAELFAAFIHDAVAGTNGRVDAFKDHDLVATIRCR